MPSAPASRRSSTAPRSISASAPRSISRAGGAVSIPPLPPTPRSRSATSARFIAAIRERNSQRTKGRAGFFPALFFGVLHDRADERGGERAGLEPRLQLGFRAREQRGVRRSRDPVDLLVRGVLPEQPGLGRPVVQVGVAVISAVTGDPRRPSLHEGGRCRRRGAAP